MSDEVKVKDDKAGNAIPGRRRFLTGGAATLTGAAMMALVPPGVRQAAWAAGSDAPEKKEVKIGFIPLTDCASVAMASVLGFDKKYGIKITPTKEASWASVRDKLVNGDIDAAHVLYGLVYGLQVGVGGPRTDMAVLMTINNNGQGISLSRKLADKGVTDGAKLAAIMKKEPREYVFAQTFPTGTHAMWLYYWLAASGINDYRQIHLLLLRGGLRRSDRYGGRTHHRRARGFANVAHGPVAEEATARHPFRLITGRLRDQWHGMSRSGRTARSFGHAPEPTVTMNAADLARRGIAAGDLMSVASVRGAVTLPAEAGDDVRPGQVFLAMHWGSAHLGGAGARGINAVTLPALDPVSRQPELKHCAVRISKAELPWRCVAFAYAAEGEALALAEKARRHLGSFAYATCVLVGRSREGVLLRGASAAAADARTLAALDALFGLDDHRTLSYDDARRGVGRRVRVREGRIEAVRLAGEVGAEPWLRELFDNQEAVTNLGVLLLSPDYRPFARAPAGPIVCSCWNVSEREIVDALARTGSGGDPLAVLQDALKCGTQCGSCLPELKRLAASAKAAA